MNRIFILLTFAFFIVNTISAREHFCTTVEKNGGPAGYALRTQTKDESKPGVTEHYLNCVGPGLIICDWDGGKSPCIEAAEGIINTNPVPIDIELTDDNDVILDIPIDDVNELIVNQLLQGEFEGEILVSDILRIEYSYVLNCDENDGVGYTMTVSLFTGEDI